MEPCLRPEASSFAGSGLVDGFMSDLRKRLEGLGISQYYDIFVAEGFDTWETILDITESDL